jgi:FAD synthetase
MEGKETRRRIVLASGTFDLLHYGHVKYLEEAKRIGGKNAKLIVVVARDSTVEKRKDRKPVMSQDQRRSLVESLKVVDEAILGCRDFDMLKVLEKTKPDVVAVGHDQGGIEREVRRAVAERGAAIQVVRIGRFGKDELNSSSRIKRRIAQSSEIVRDE